MTTPVPIPCYICGCPVVEIGAVKWDRAPTQPDFITALHVVCRLCLEKIQVEEDQYQPEVFN